MFIEWKDDVHSIGIETIDFQHKGLFLITNQLHGLMNLEHYQGEAIKILKRLYAYTGYHFASEESLLQEYAYPSLRPHMGIHRKFKEEIKEALEGIREKQNYSLAPLQDFLVQWIIEHIQGEDVRYAAYFKKEGIEPDMHFTISDKKRNDVLEQWQKQQLSLEIRDIDNQHRELIYILQQTNDLQHTSETRKRLYLPVIIKKLFYYTQFHFSYEEELMAKNSYPLLKPHQILHKDFIREIIKFAEEYKAGIRGLTDEIILFLKDWTIRHILTEDRKYKDYMIEQNIN